MRHALPFLAFLVPLLWAHPAASQTCGAGDDLSTFTGVVTSSIGFPGGGIAVRGQSFTVNCTGYVSSITVDVHSVSTSPTTGELRVYAGDGGGGSLLDTEPYSIAGSGQHTIVFTGSRPAVSPGAYTFFLVGATGLGSIRASDANPYGGGILYTSFIDGYSDYDYNFGVAFADADLPVELVSFDAHTDGHDVLLRWETAGETNNAGFEVERQEGQAWRPLGFIEGRGTTTAPQAYTFRAAGLTPGMHRFRLRQVDYDGAFEYSPEVEASVAVPGLFQLTAAYPNPFNPEAAFTLAVQTAQRVHVAVFDVLGRLVAVLHDGLLAAGAAHRFTVGGTGLPGGTYLLGVEGETFRASQHLVLVK